MKFDDIAEKLISKAEFIPLITPEDESFLLSYSGVPAVLPILPLTENVLFPGVVLPIAATRPRSVRLLKAATKHKSPIGVIAQRKELDDPQMSDLYSIGVVAHVLKTFDLPNGTTMAVVQGLVRFHLDSLNTEGDYFEGGISLEKEPDITNGRTFHRYVNMLRKRYEQVLGYRNNDIKDLPLKNIQSDKIFINYVCSHFEVDAAEKQDLLEAHTYERRMEMLQEMLDDEAHFFQVREDVDNKTREMMDRQQREFFLNQQMRVIQDELGNNPSDQDIAELRRRAARKHWSTDIEDTFEKELKKLQRMPPQTPDYSVQYNYLDWLLTLPWNECTTDCHDPQLAKKVLDKDHFGIEKVKERIIEHIAVLGLKEDMKSPILCLVGPPGTGKTSLGRSIASAMSRNYVRMALGGLHDEAEIRGHRRTYIGAMPGRIVQSIKKAKSSNPVFILDEIDKVQGMSNNGDPTSALLEVLDPEQNVAFHDNFLDVNFDLSKVLFVATANTTSTIQPALLDRMEIIDLSGYILEEKLEIAKRHLIPKQLKEHGFKKGAIKFSPEVLEVIINEYTRESGVRQLEKVITKIIRRQAVKVASGQPFDKTIRRDSLKEMLGLPIHTSEIRGKEPRVGVVTGLAWTQVGGEILFIESSISNGKGTLSMTGNLGDVMKESATLAFEYIKANAKRFGIDSKQIEKNNIHIHVPEGATPKDGPSAGITMFVAMVSAFSGRKVRPEVAMTGEITLRGAVTPVGGIREKILAAKRAGITDLILCEENRRDVEDVPAEYLKGLSFHYINEICQALPLAFEK